MKTPLVNVEILSIYKRHGQRVLLPKRMAKAAPDMCRAIKGISDDLAEAGGRLILSDLFRSYDMQLQAHLDWKTRKKSAYSPPPGGSMHEAGRAFDLSLQDMKISLSDFWSIAKKWGLTPIISEPDRHRSEAWHFDCRGSHESVYDYYKTGKATNMKPYKAMAISSILSIGEHVDKFGNNQKEALLQSGLVRLGYELGNIDGIIGRNTRLAIEEAGIEYTFPEDMLQIVENLLQEKYPGEYREEFAVEEALFDYEEPEHIEG